MSGNMFLNWILRKKFQNLHWKHYAIMVGGTDNITFDAVLEMLSRVRRFPIPVILEISELEAITPGYDYYFIPMVLNIRDKSWVMDKQHQAIKEYKSVMNWKETMME